MLWRCSWRSILRLWPTTGSRRWFIFGRQNLLLLPICRVWASTSMKHFFVVAQLWTRSTTCCRHSCTRQWSASIIWGGRLGCSNPWVLFCSAVPQPLLEPIQLIIGTRRLHPFLSSTLLIFPMRTTPVCCKDCAVSASILSTIKRCARPTFLAIVHNDCWWGNKWPQKKWSNQDG